MTKNTGCALTPTINQAVISPVMKSSPLPMHASTHGWGLWDGFYPNVPSAPSCWVISIVLTVE